MKYLSLFSGIGGFELGIQQAYEKTAHYKSEVDELHAERDIGGDNCNELQGTAPCCVGYSEIDKYAVSIYQKHFPNHKNYGDITKINPAELPDFDLLVGGFPCQAFSIAGKRMGFKDTRGTLFYEIARILRAKQPGLCLLENVKGLLSHDNGLTFKTIIATLDELGYDLQWQVLNSKNFGVPQNRERIFIVGHLRGTSRPEVFPFSTSDGKNVSEGTYAHTLNSSDWCGPNRNQKQTTIRTDEQDSPEEWNQSDSTDHIRRTPYTDGARIRRLTPTECERLQGFPDGWTKWGVTEEMTNGSGTNYLVKHHKEVSDTQRYKCLGNAVTVNVIQAIMERLIKYHDQ